MFIAIHHLWFATDGGNADEANPVFLSLFASTESGTGRRRGDEIVRMYDALQPSLLGDLVGLGLVREEAEDVVQETFLRILRSIEEVQDEEHLRPWIFRVAHNLTVDQFRSGRYRADANSVEFSTLHEVLSYPGLSPDSCNCSTRRSGGAIYRDLCLSDRILEILRVCAIRKFSLLDYRSEFDWKVKLLNMEEANRMRAGNVSLNIANS